MSESGRKGTKVNGEGRGAIVKEKSYKCNIFRSPTQGLIRTLVNISRIE